MWEDGVPLWHASGLLILDLSSHQLSFAVFFFLFSASWCPHGSSSLDLHRDGSPEGSYEVKEGWLLSLDITFAFLQRSRSKVFMLVLLPFPWLCVNIRTYIQKSRIESWLPVSQDERRIIIYPRLWKLLSQRHRPWRYSEICARIHSYHRHRCRSPSYLTLLPPAGIRLSWSLAGAREAISGRFRVLQMPSPSWRLWGSIVLSGLSSRHPRTMDTSVRTRLHHCHYSNLESLVIIC